MHGQPKRKYYRKMLETLVDYNDRNNAPLSNENLQQAISTVVAETEAGKRNIILDANNVAMDTFCQSPITTNTQGENANAVLTSERLNNLDALEETLKYLKINDAGYYNSDKNDAEGDPKSNPKLATHTNDRKKIKVKDIDTTNGKFPQ